MTSRLVAAAFLLVAAWPLSALGQAGSTDKPEAQTTAREAKEKPATVFVCGNGVAPHFLTIVDALSEYLAEHKVRATLSDGNSSSKGACLTKATESGAMSLLYVAADISEKDRSYLTLQCFNAEGKKLWEEALKGPFITTSVTATVKGLTEKMVKKIEPRLGQEGLPVSR